jgi:hypothetical protein
MAATGFFMSIAPVLAKSRPALRNIFDLGHMASGSYWLGARPAEAKKQTPALVRLHQPQRQLARGGKMARDEILDGGRQFSALKIAAFSEYFGNIRGHIPRPALGGVEAKDPNREAVLSVE